MNGSKIPDDESRIDWARFAQDTEKVELEWEQIGKPLFAKMTRMVEEGWYDEESSS